MVYCSQQNLEKYNMSSTIVIQELFKPEAFFAENYLCPSGEGRFSDYINFIRYSTNITEYTVYCRIFCDKNI